MTRVVEQQRRFTLVATVMVGFRLRAPRELLSEVELWAIIGDVLGGAGAATAGVLDDGMPKPQGELLVYGSCHTPGNTPTSATYVRVVCGSVDKSLAVIGDRYWQGGLGGFSEPQMFTTMPIDWSHAFGGADYPQNPAGKGAGPVGGVHELPNIESYGRGELLTTSSQRPPLPMGFGAYHCSWLQRSAKAGTYGSDWFRREAPGLASDIDPTYFNTAPMDQWVTGFFRGDEAVAIYNMHPTESCISSRLPGVRARVFLTQVGSDAREMFREVATSIDTVVLLPEAGIGIVLFRGEAAIREDDALDARSIVVACEDQALPRSLEHYQDVLSRRTDPDRELEELLADLTDADLMPSAADGWLSAPPVSDVSTLLTRSGADPMRANLERARIAKTEQVRADLEAKGLRLDDYLPSSPIEAQAPPPLTDPTALGDYLKRVTLFTDAKLSEAKSFGAKAEADARALCEARGVTYEDVMRPHRAGEGGPPKFSAKAHIEMLRRAAEQGADQGAEHGSAYPALVGPGAVAQAEAHERALFDMYRQNAHLQPPAGPLDPDHAQRLRLLVEMARDAGESLARRDLTGAPLAGMDLRGMNFQGALLESADFTGADLSNTDFTGAVLVRATLRKARLLSAKLTGANLGGAVLDEANLTTALLDSANVMGSSLCGALLHGAQLQDAEFSGTIFWSEANGAADLSGAALRGATLLRLDLRAVKLVGADLTGATFAELNLDGGDLGNAKATNTTFFQVTAEKTSFRGALLESSSFTNCMMRGADFREGSMRDVTMRGVMLDDACFAAAMLDGIDFSEASLQRAVLSGASAVAALLVRTNLTDAELSETDLRYAMLPKSVLHGTDLSNACLFGADLRRVRVNALTSINGANLRRAVDQPTERDYEES